MFNFLLDLVFPKKCYGCDTLGTYLCSKCAHNHLNINFIQKCHVCGSESRIGMVHKECSELSFLSGLINVGVYNDFSKKIIQEMKYQGIYTIAIDIGRLMSEYLTEFYSLQNFMMCPIPLHKSKERTRGFNQADYMAKEIARNTELAYSRLINRVRMTKTQVGMSKEEREVNLKGAFQLNSNYQYPIPKKVLLIDDVYTTGTTMNECAKLLLENGAQQVVGFSFVRGS